jgi:hypothetical protein
MTTGTAPRAFQAIAARTRVSLSSGMDGMRRVRRAERCLPWVAMARLTYPDPPLRQGRVVLRPWERRDLPAVAKAAADPAIVRWNHLPQPFDAAAVRRRFDAIPAQLVAGQALRLLIGDVRGPPRRAGGDRRVRR